MKGQHIILPPWCPFCGQRIGRPHEPEKRSLGEFPVGRCSCGAAYACDATGHNVGSAMIEAMVYACNDDWDTAWSLVPEEDYLTGRIERYDEVTHQVVETGNLDGRAVRGVLYFVRLHRDLAEIMDRRRRAEEAAAAGEPVEPERDPGRKRQRASKSLVRELVAAGDTDGLVDLLFDDKRTLGFLQRLLYTPDDHFRWQAIDAMGRACGRYASRHPGPVSDLLHRLFAAADDSAASSWGTVEAIGAIIAGRPNIFGAFTRHLLRYMNDPGRQALVIWSLGTVADKRPDLIRNLPFFHFFRYLKHPDPQVRGLTLRLLERIRATEARSEIAALAGDQAEFTWFDDGDFQTATVGELARRVLTTLEKGPPPGLQAAPAAPAPPPSPLAGERP